MRSSFGVALIGLFWLAFGGQALAAPKAKKAPKHPVQTMDSNDPAEKELSEKKVDEQKSDEAVVQEKEQTRAEAAQAAEARARDKTSAFGNVLVGFGEAPEPGPGAGQTSRKITSVTLMVGGRYDLSPELSVGVRIPWTIGSARQQDGLHKTDAALGAPELTGEYRVGLSPFTRLPIFAGLGIPIAQGNYDTDLAFRQTRLNEMADAASGYRDGELFGVKRLPIVLGVGIEYERKALSLHAANKFVFGVKVGGNIPLPADPSGAGSYELKSVSFRDVLSAGIAYRFLERPNLFGALDTWTAYNGINAFDFVSNSGASGPTRFQVVFEPRVGARFGKISPSAGFIFPIGGRLADTSARGFELHCDVAF